MAGAETGSGCTSMTGSSADSGPRLPGPSSALAVSGRLRSEGPRRCPARHGIHRSYSGVRSPGGRSSIQNALVKNRQMTRLLPESQHITQPIRLLMSK